MKSIQKVLWLFALCTNMLFFSKNVSGQCSSFNVTASKTSDGSSLGDVTVTASISGGGASTNFTWYTAGYSFVGVGAIKSNLSAGSYCVIARDSSSSPICRDTFCLTISDTGTFNCANLQSSLYEADSCQIGDVNLYASVWGGSGSYSYSWNTGATSQNLLNRTNGTFSVIITDILYGCKDTLYKTVVDDTCNPCTNFKNNSYISEYDPCQKNDITLTANKWTGSNKYKYLWNTGATSKSISNRGVGAYWVKITDSVYGCIDTMFITVADDTCNPCDNHQAAIYKQDSCGKNDITLKAYPNNWWNGKHLFLWNTGSTDSNLYNRGSGTYWVIVTDTILGCVDTAHITVVDDTCNICDLYKNSGYIYESDPCQKNDITLTAYKWGGSYSYFYLWNTGATTQSISNKGGGSYWVKVTDTLYGCIDTLFITVTDDTCSPCQYFNAWINQNDSCQKNDITLNAYPRDSSAVTYTYLWNTGATTPSIINRSTGTYWVTVTDSIFGCVDSAFITVVDDTCNFCQNFNLSIYEIDTSCVANDIILLATVNSGSSQKEFNWSTGFIDTPLGYSQISNRPGGTYTVIARDLIYGCKDTMSITVVDDTCDPCRNFYYWISEEDPCLANDITLRSYPIDSPNSNRYSYLWSNGATSNFISNQSSGNYWMRVKDSLTGCIDTSFITVVDDTCNPCDNFGGFMYKYDSCQSNDIKVYAYAWGGSGNYSYVWNTGSTSSSLTNRGTGWYKVTITDVTNGCIYKDSIYAVDSNFKCCRAYFYTNASAVASTKTFYGYSNVYDSIGGGTTTYTWNFGDGNTGNGQTKNHTYASSGNKTVCLYISTVSGCKDTFCSVVNSPAPGKNLKVSHYGIPYIKDTNRYTYITYQNIGTTTENGIVEYKYPVGMTLVSSTISPLTHIGNKITFSVGSLAPGAGGTIYILMKTPSSFALGSIKCDTAIILPVSGDIAPTNNTSYECDSVVASWDPNDKTPNPKGIGPDGNIPPATSEIGYLIRFENEGNWRTYRVRVDDEIDPSFEINSLMIGDASHAYRLVRKDNKLTWYFDNIELTPKSVDPNRSHGYIQYTLQLKSGLSLGTQIKNTAYIYFDANPAIITNTTKNTLKNADGTASVSRIESDEMLDFDLKRNGDKLTVFSPSKMQALRIFDISGKLLLEKELHSDKEEIENVQLSQSIYIVHVDIDNQTVIKKIKF